MNIKWVYIYQAQDSEDSVAVTVSVACPVATLSAAFTSQVAREVSALVCRPSIAAAKV